MKLFLCLFSISLGRYRQKILTKGAGGFGKKIKSRDGHKGGEVGGMGVSTEGGRKNFATWNYFCVHLVFHWGDIVKKFLPKAGGSEKR